MGFFGLLARLSAVVVALLAIALGCLLTNVPGKLGLWSYLDSQPSTKGMLPFIHEGEWGFNHTTLGPEALKGRTVLVTGANSGLGLGSVRYLATHGANVVLGCRSLKNCEEAISSVKKEAPGAILTPFVLDLSSFKSIDRFAVEVVKSTPKLNSLILNAGIFQFPFGLTEDGLEQQIGVNHFGHALLVRRLEGLLKQSATKELPSTVVVVSSSEHFVSYPEGVRLSVEALNDPSTYDKALAYSQSKLANVLYAQQLAERLRPSGVLVNCIHPGGVDTNVFTHLLDPIQASFPAVGERIRALISFLLWNSKDAALTQVYAAVSPEIISKRVHGKYFHPIAREVLPCRIHSTNATLQKALWDLTEAVLDEKTK